MFVKLKIYVYWISKIKESNQISCSIEVSTYRAWGHISSQVLKIISCSIEISFNWTWCHIHSQVLKSKIVKIQENSFGHFRHLWHLRSWSWSTTWSSTRSHSPTAHSSCKIELSISSLAQLTSSSFTCLIIADVSSVNVSHSHSSASKVNRVSVNYIIVPCIWVAYSSRWLSEIKCHLLNINDN